MERIPNLHKRDTVHSLTRQDMDISTLYANK